MYKSKRKELKEIWSGENYLDIGNIVRFAPSACNTQPWLVESYENELKVLKAILIMNICRFTFIDREDAKNAIQYCSNIKEAELVSTLRSLDDMYGVITFDEVANTYDLVAEANGFNEFKRIYTRYKLGVTATIDDISEDLLKELSLNRPVDTSFAQEHNILHLCP